MKVTFCQISLPESNHYDFNETFTAAGLLDPPPPPVMVKSKKPSVGRVNKHAPMKKKIVRANNAPSITKTLSKAIMNWSRFMNKFLKNPNDENKAKYNKQRNYCDNLLRRGKKRYYDSLNLKDIRCNKIFLSTVKPLFSDRGNPNRKIIQIEDNTII